MQPTAHQLSLPFTTKAAQAANKPMPCADDRSRSTPPSPSKSRSRTKTALFIGVSLLTLLSLPDRANAAWTDTGGGTNSNTVTTTVDTTTFTGTATGSVQAGANSDVLIVGDSTALLGPGQNVKANGKQGLRITVNTGATISSGPTSVPLIDATETTDHILSITNTNVITNSKGAADAHVIALTGFQGAVPAASGLRTTAIFTHQPAPTGPAQFW